MNGSRPLLVVLIHGIGPQNARAQYEFLDRLREATVKRLQGMGRGELAPRLIVKRADWSRLFPERRDWLAHLFTDQAGWWTRCKRIAVMLLFAVTAPVIVALGTGSGMLHLPPPVLGWVVGTAAGLVAAILATWSIILPRFPWGHLWTFGRGFEANSLSDVILYGSDAPREEILKVVLDRIEPYLTEAYSIGKAGTLTALPVIFVGHSLGTVVAYDILLGASALSRQEETAVHRELATIESALEAVPMAHADQGTSTAAPPGERGTEANRQPVLQEKKAFLVRAKRVQDAIYPVGLVTMGSPIALFLFRKPQLLDDTNLWTKACPAAFAQDGALDTPVGALRWRWQNFWHSADFVAHRLEPLFNNGYPAAKFVEDVKTSAWARDPISAHSTYWTNPTILRRIAAQLADVLVMLP